MAKKKIAILGGGMAGLAAAYQLTRTPALQAMHDVTVYQMGWRLGGKAASGRDKLHRNLEHGLHVWFGCYHNMFRMTQDVYAVWQKPPGCPLQQWTDVAKPQAYTPIGVQDHDKWTYFPMTWPMNDGVPGQGPLDMTPHEVLTTLMNLLLEVIRGVTRDLETLWTSNAAQAVAPVQASASALPVSFSMATDALFSLVGDEIARARQLFARSRFAVLSFEEKMEAVVLWTKSLQGTPQSRDPQQVQELIDLHAQAKQAFDYVAANVPASAAPSGSPIAIKLRIVRELFDIGHAVFRGYWLDLILRDAPFESIDQLDFRQWLLTHGADPAIVNDSSVVRILYDTMFQYMDGDVAQPSYAAGTALGVIGRLIGTYHGSMMWSIQAGMGEAVVAPVYDVLVANGVSFRFFRKVRNLELSADGRSIRKIALAVQAKVTSGDYQPTFIDPDVHVRYWPSEPDWKQLVDGDAMEAANVDFESHWYAWPDAGYEELVAGTDFDCVVLAIAMGAYKPLNAEPGMCDALIAKNRGFADFVGKMGLVPSVGLQLWSDWTPQALGWTSGKAALVSGPEYLDIWADMSQVLAFEPWPSAAKPKTLYYLCGTYDTTLYKEPSTNRSVPATARAQLRAQALEWLNTSAYVMWPKACDGAAFRFDVLTDVTGGAGTARFDAQFLRPNIDPTECCIGSAAGTTRYRLLPDQSGFDNLILAGEATRHGFNTTTIEGAVMSGMAASRAICGHPAIIVGYDFLRAKPSDKVQ